MKHTFIDRDGSTKTYCSAGLVVTQKLRDVVTPKTRDHEKHAAHHNQARAALSGGSWRKTVHERILMADTPAIAAWWPAIY